MTKLTHLEKQTINEALIKKMRCLLAGKETELIDETGINYTSGDIEKVCLVGNIGHPPEANSPYIQAPNSMGMVLLLKPDKKGNIHINVSGRFDLSFRSIPSIDYQTKKLIFDGMGVLKEKQNVAEELIRHTVQFKETHITFSKEKLNQWVENTGNEIETSLDNLETLLLKNKKIYKRCNLSASGYPMDLLPWSDEIKTQEALNDHLETHLFSDETILRYNISISARLRKAPVTIKQSDENYLLEIYLVNRTVREDARAYGVYEPFLLDSKIQVELLSGEHLLLPHKLNPEDYQYAEEDGLPGYGITCSVNKVSDTLFETNSMPVYEQPLFETPEPEAVSMAVHPTFKNCSEQTNKMLDSFLNALTHYADQWQEYIDDMPSKAHDQDSIDEAIKERQLFLEERESIEEGIELLKTHDDLRLAFSLMNKSMGQAIQIQNKPFNSWRLFQLGFILTQIRSIYERMNEEDIQKSYDLADVLWFATGGGKTEAYTGIICMALFYQRMKNRFYGVSAWMRYPLRMLSAQQFQRLSYVIAQANIIKYEANIIGSPFTIGYFTGGGTPNKISREKPEGNNVFLPELNQVELDRYKFIKDCPYCGGIDNIEMHRDIDTVRIKHVCQNQDCFSNTDNNLDYRGFSNEIGIFVSDDECYRYLPSIMVGTIDKLAIIGLNQKFNLFFGSANYYCPEHGYTRSTKCEHLRVNRNDKGTWISEPCGNNSRTSQVKTYAIEAMLDPGFSFLIQDELHLLKGDLGNFDAHYESLLYSIQEGFNGNSPKILAATATIKDYKDHLLNLYLKPGRQFPVSGIRRGESFYSRKKSDNGKSRVRRYMISLLPVIRKKIPDFSSTQISLRFLHCVDNICAQLSSDNISFLLDNGLSEEKRDLVLKHLQEQLNVSLIYVNTKNLITSVKENIEIHNEANDQSIMPITLDGGTPLEQIQSSIAFIETKKPEDDKRQIIATNVISHGVDIERLNFMVLSGWPYSMSEYIQSSARSGRIHPGIIYTVLNYQRLYEQNIFLNFSDYHFFMERLVESVPINRYAPNVLERTLPGIITAIILNWLSQQQSLSQFKIGFMFKNLSKALNSQVIVRQLLADKIYDALMVSNKPISQYFDKRVITQFEDKLKELTESTLTRMEQMTGASLELTITDVVEEIIRNRPFTSFRDIEPQVEIVFDKTEDETMLQVLSRF